MSLFASIFPLASSIISSSYQAAASRAAREAQSGKDSESSESDPPSLLYQSRSPY